MKNPNDELRFALKDLEKGIQDRYPITREIASFPSSGELAKVARLSTIYCARSMGTEEAGKIIDYIDRVISDYNLLVNLLNGDVTVNPFQEDLLFMNTNQGVAELNRVTEKLFPNNPEDYLDETMVHILTKEVEEHINNIVDKINKESRSNPKPIDFGDTNV